MKTKLSLLLSGLFLIACTNIAYAYDECTDCEIPLPEDVCFSITNYWGFDENNNPIPFEGQADSDPNHTATMYYFTADDAGTFVAAMDAFTDSSTKYYGASVELTGWGILPVYDRFGKQSYRDGVFWHDTYKQYVIGIDIMTPEPLHYLDCNGKILLEDK